MIQISLRELLNKDKSGRTLDEEIDLYTSRVQTAVTGNQYYRHAGFFGGWGIAIIGMMYAQDNPEAGLATMGVGLLTASVIGIRELVRNVKIGVRTERYLRKHPDEFRYIRNKDPYEFYKSTIA